MENIHWFIKKTFILNALSHWEMTKFFHKLCDSCDVSLSLDDFYDAVIGVMIPMIWNK